MRKQKTTAGVLRAAAQIVRRGWCQGSYDNNDYIHHKPDRFCAKGAIGLVMFGNSTGELYNDTVVAPVYDVLLRAVGDDRSWLAVRSVGACPIVQWNDATDQTAENVAQAMEFAAILWEQEQQQKSAATAETRETTAVSR